MPSPVDRDAVQRLVAEGAQLVEVLPDEEYRDEHLPGAVHLPLKSLSAATPSGWTPPARWSSIAGMPSET